jgi:hypothetical protein
MYVIFGSYDKLIFDTEVDLKKAKESISNWLIAVYQARLLERNSQGRFYECHLFFG